MNLLISLYLICIMMIFFSSDITVKMSKTDLTSKLSLRSKLSNKVSLGVVAGSFNFKNDTDFQFIHRNSGYCIIPKFESLQPDIELVLGECKTSSISARWTVSELKGKKYIKNMASLFNMQDSTDELGAVRIKMAKYDEKSTEFDWKIESPESCTFTTITSDNPKPKCIQVKDNNFTLGNPLILADCDKTTNQEWEQRAVRRLPQVKPYVYEDVELYMVDSGLCLATTWGSSEPGSKINIATCQQSDYTQWKLYRINDKTEEYRIQHMKSGLYLDIHNHSTVYGNKAQISTYYGTSVQRFEFMNNDDGSFFIKDIGSQYCLTTFGKKVLYDNVYQGDCDKNENLKFKIRRLHKAPSKREAPINVEKVVTVFSPVPDDGDYEIVNVHTILCLAPIEDSKDKGVVKMFGEQCMKNKNTHWRVSTEADGSKLLTHVPSGQVLEVPNSSKADLMQLITGASLKTANQKYRFEGEYGRMDYRIISKDSSKCLDILQINRYTGGLVIQKDCGDSRTQLWQFRKYVAVYEPKFAKSGYLVRHKKSGRCLSPVTTPASEEAKDIKMIITDCNSADANQVFRLGSSNIKQTQIVLMTPNLALSSPSNEKEVIMNLATFNPELKTQLWELSDEHDKLAYNHIINIGTALCLTTKGDNIATGTNVIQMPCLKTASFDWELRLFGAMGGTNPIKKMGDQ
jgi:hypothetical protein